MEIYHGSTVSVPTPLILPANRKMDFGEGFYTTSNEIQAANWARDLALKRNTSEAFVSCYSFDITAAKANLTIIEFEEPNECWLDFVSFNRDKKNNEIYSIDYDMVIGPVADDNVYSTVQFYRSGKYTKAYAIEQLKVRKLYNQILFHTTRSLRFCHFTDTKRVEAPHGR